MVKRGCDIILASTGLIVLCPFFFVIALLIKLDSKGPVFFRQIRVGKNGRPFQMLKLRTMMDSTHWTGPPLSPKNDPRVTAFGAILRRFKINEFPQLINVLRGDMSFVGPRPEVPEFVSLYGPDGKRILSVRPGIVGPSQIHLRNEDELYEEGVDPRQYYIDHILPRKLKVDLDYVKNRSFLKDLGYLLQGIKITLTGAISRRHFFENAQQIVLFVCDTAICGFSYFLANFLRFEGQLLPIHNAVLWHTLPYVIISRMITLTYFGLYGSLVQYFSFHELMKIIKGVTVSSAVIILLTFLIGERAHPRSVFAIDWFILMFLLGGYRLAFRAMADQTTSGNNEAGPNLLICGAGNMGDLALRYLKIQGGGNVVAFVDDDPKKMRKSFHGVKVLGTRYDIEALARLYHVDHVLIAMDQMNHESLDHVKVLCEKAGVSYEVFALAN